ncbi:MAG: nicotinate-nucleotide--dimethylbenzimidazole phosphoribosyltransferase, partial [Alphaproteobacteria bacterium]|nr:nicotinate-nucleotide--dimethylbenzimidazole phosphoribosyltransferase [Alphaproteobacteria bacterium]
MPLTFNSAADYTAAIAAMPSADSAIAEQARERQGQLTKPPGSLGRLEEIAVWMASWQGAVKPELNAPACLIFAGNHGVAALGVSAFPQEVTAQMVGNFAAGGAAINQLTRAAGASLDVIALDLDNPTADFTQGPAMTAAETLKAMQAGANAIPADADLLLVGEMGIANTTAAAAIGLACLGGKAEDWVGPGTGVDAAGLTLKADVINRGIAANKDQLSNGFGILSALGGRELAAIAGAVLAARHRRIPVLLDGFISTASALPLLFDDSAALDHCLISHRSQEPGHHVMIEKTGKQPIIDLGLRLGEGSGAATALPIVRAAVASHSGMATFAEAG